MKLYSWLRALLIFMVMSAVLMNIIPPRYEGSYKVVMRLIFLMILLKPVLLLLFNEEYITDRVNTLYNDYSKNIAGYSSSYTGDSSLQSDYYSYVSNAVKQTVISRVLNIAEECKVEVNNVKVELNDKSILNKSDTDYSSVITGIDISVKNKKSVSSLESTQNAKTALNKSDIEQFAKMVADNFSIDEILQYTLSQVQRIFRIPMFRTERRIIIFNYENILNKLGKDKILIVILAGILLMVISIPVKDRQTVSENTTSNQESGEATQKMYEEYVEKRLEDTLSDVEGAGKVKVMVSLKNSSEKILAKDTDYSDEEVNGNNDENSNSTQKTETHIFYDTANGNTPYVVMENMPVIEGVIIVCEGGDNKELVSEITNAVYGLLNVPVHKIKVMKMS